MDGCIFRPLSNTKIARTRLARSGSRTLDLKENHAKASRTYGIDTVGDLFTPRQLVALNTFCDLVTEARDRIRRDAIAGGLLDDQRPLHAGGAGAAAYADGVGTYLEFAQTKAANRNTSLCLWEHRMDRLVATFGRQALPMVWDYAETNPLAGAGGDFFGAVESVCEVIEKHSTHRYLPARFRMTR